MTDLQKKFIELLDERFEVNLDQIRMTEDQIPLFESLNRVESYLDEIKEKHGFKDNRDL